MEHLLNFKGPLLKSKAPMVEAKFVNIHISHKTQLAIINMLLNFKVAPHN
jgi:hypothetical protein